MGVPPIVFERKASLVGRTYLYMEQSLSMIAQPCWTLTHRYAKHVVSAICPFCPSGDIAKQDQIMHNNNSFDVAHCYTEVDRLMFVVIWSTVERGLYHRSGVHIRLLKTMVGRVYTYKIYL